jgi:hypothetical protein
MEGKMCDMLHFCDVTLSSLSQLHQGFLFKIEIIFGTANPE